MLVHNGKEYRNLQEQVLKNKEDIEQLQQGGVDIDMQQTSGTSTTAVMSQNATTNYTNTKSTEALNSAKAYTDTKIETVPEYEAGDNIIFTQVTIESPTDTDYQINANIDSSNNIGTDNGRVSMLKYFETNGIALSVSYSNSAYTTGAITFAIRYYDEDKEILTAYSNPSGSTYGRIVMYRVPLGVATTDVFENTYITVNGNQYKLTHSIEEKTTTVISSSVSNNLTAGNGITITEKLPDEADTYAPYLLNMNLDNNNNLTAMTGRMVIDKFFKNYGSALSISYSNSNYVPSATPQRYFDANQNPLSSVTGSTYAKIVMVGPNTTITADQIENTTITVNGTQYTLTNNPPQFQTTQEIALDEEALPSDTYKDTILQIFEHMVFIGDSLTAGFTNKNGTTYGSNTARQKNRNYPSYIGLKLGRTITNLGYGSTTTHSWRYADDNLGANITQALIAGTDFYSICLGWNDNAQQKTIGTLNDIKTDWTQNADSFYGNYDYIIRTLLDFNDISQIFIFTMYYPNDNSAYNTAIRNLVALYPARVHLIDVANSKYNESFWKSEVVRNTFNGHFTPLVYQMEADIMCKLISEYMYTNYKRFYGTPYETLDTTTDIFTISITAGEGGSAYLNKSKGNLGGKVILSITCNDGYTPTATLNGTAITLIQNTTITTKYSADIYPTNATNTVVVTFSQTT